MSIKHCNRCGRDKSRDDFAPSQQQRKNAWCRECYRTWYVEREGGLKKRPCDWCGAEMVCTSRRAAEARVFCSRRCKSEERNENLRLEREASKPERNCRHCGISMPKSMRSGAVYCSAECNSHAHQQTRKASSKIGARQKRIDRAYIIARDGGRCHLCGRKPRGAKLTIDHVVPLARGGTHTSENLRVACLSCNCSKGDRAANDQLMMVG